MAFIQESQTHEDLITISVLEREKDETVEPWEIIYLETSFKRSTCTPRELRKLGKWLINEGKRIGREYNSNGKKKRTKDAKI